MSFSFRKCVTDDGLEFKGLVEIQPDIIDDNRGYFFESYNEKDFANAGFSMKFVQDNQSKSSKGVLRGLHFQTKHPQGKLIRALEGKVYDVAVDLRNESVTFGRYYALILDGEKQNQIYIPEGFAHGIYVLSDSAVIAYKCTDFYDPSGESGILWNDKTIGIDWNKIIDDFEKIKFSDKDKLLPSFKVGELYFDTDGKWIGR